MIITLQASPAFRRNVLLAALGVAAIEVALFAVLWRLGTLADPGGDRRAALLFVVLGSAMTLQAMAVVGLAWVVVAMSRTTLLADVTGLTLEHPWRRWHGAGADVQHAWLHNQWLVLEVRGQWRRWYVRAGRDAGEALAHIRSTLPPEAWLDGAARLMHLARTTLPQALAAAGLGGFALLWVMSLLEELR
jgi:hypothetical protein